MHAIRRLGPHDGDVVAALATYSGPTDRSDLLADPNAIFGSDSCSHTTCRAATAMRGSCSCTRSTSPIRTCRRGVARALLERLADEARARGIERGFVLTEPENGPANALYAAPGGAVAGTDVVWQFRYEV